MLPRIKYSSILSTLGKGLISCHYRSLKAVDFIVNATYDFTKKWLINPYARWWLVYSIPIVVDSVQNDVLNEAPRFDDYRAHLRVPPQQRLSIALPRVVETQSLKTSETSLVGDQFYFPANTRQGLLGVPDLNSPSRFETLSKIAVSESRRLLLEPSTFETPKKAVQVCHIRVAIVVCHHCLAGFIIALPNILICFLAMYQCISSMFQCTSFPSHSAGNGFHQQSNL